MSLILVIDDDKAIRDLLRRVLESASYKVIDAPDGRAAMRMWREIPAGDHYRHLDARARRSGIHSGTAA